MDTYGDTQMILKILLDFANKNFVLLTSQTLINKGFQDLKFSKSPKLSKNPRKSRIFGEVLKRGA